MSVAGITILAFLTFAAGWIAATLRHRLRIRAFAREEMSRTFSEEMNRLRVARLAIHRVMTGEYEKDPLGWSDLVRRGRILAAVALLVLAAVPAEAGVSRPRKVVRVSDGDTLVVEGYAERLRLIGVDAPEVRRKGGEIASAETCGREAWEFLDKELRGKEVRVEQHGFDRYGRRLVYAWRAGDRWFVNAEAVASGFSTMERRFKIAGHPSRRARIEAAASTASLGAPPVCVQAVPK